MDFSTCIIIFILIAFIYLYYKYQKIEKYDDKISNVAPVQRKTRTYTFPHHNMIKHMTYSAGPFDETIWSHGGQGGKSIKAQRYMPNH